MHVLINVIYTQEIEPVLHLIISDIGMSVSKVTRSTGKNLEIPSELCTRPNSIIATHEHARECIVCARTPFL